MSRLDEIKARLEAATPGPWVSDDSNIFSVPLGKMRHMGKMRHKGSCRPLGFIATTTQGYDNFENNEDFIANAPADIAFLLSEIERLKAASNVNDTVDFLSKKAEECRQQIIRANESLSEIKEIACKHFESP